MEEFNRGVRGLNVTVTIQDETWRKIGTWKWNDKDEKAKARNLKSIIDSCGVTFKPRIDKDIDWLK